MGIGGILSGAAGGIRGAEDYQRNQEEGEWRREDRDHTRELRDYEREMRGVNSELTRGNLEITRAQLDDFHRERARTETKRGIAAESVGRDQADKAALDQYDAARAGIAGNVPGDANYPALDEARPGGIQPPELKGRGEAGMLAELMEEARAAGRVDEYLALRETMRQVESEGIVDVLRAARTGANETQLRDIYNARGADKVVRVVKRTDEEGRIVLEGYKQDGSMVEIDVDQWETALGLKPKQEWDVKDGVMFEKGSGPGSAVEIGKQYAPNSYFLTTKDADGTDRIFDIRTMKYVDQAGNEVGGVPGLSRKDADGILSALTKLFKVSDIESMTEEGREKLGRALGIATQLYKNGAVDSQGRKLTPAEAAAVAGDVVDGRLAEADAVKRFLPKKPVAATGGKPPVEGARQANDGKWYVQKDGKWHQWVPEANAAPTPEPAKPAATPKSGMRPVKPPAQTPNRMPIVGGINDAVSETVGGIGEAVSEGVGGVARVLRGEAGVRPLPAEQPIEATPLPPPAPPPASTDFSGRGIAPAATPKDMSDEQIVTESMALNKDLDRLHDSIERAKKLNNEAMLRRLERERTEKLRRLNMLQKEIQENRRVRSLDAGVAHG